MKIIIGNWKGNFEIIAIIVLLIMILVSHTGCSCSRLGPSHIFSMFNDVREGFGIGDFASVYSSPPNPANWEQPNLVITPGNPLPQGVVDIINRPKQQIPLPSGESLMFAKTNFKKECCPNTFSNSMGCACMTLGQYKYLNERGGNNAPPQEDF